MFCILIHISYMVNELICRVFQQTLISADPFLHHFTPVLLTSQVFPHTIMNCFMFSYFTMLQFTMTVQFLT